MPDQLEGSRTLPVNYKLMPDGSVAELLAVVEGGGTYGYKAGTSAPGTVDVPATASVRRVSVIAGGGTATVVIAGGDTITIPAGGVFDERIPGLVAPGADVVISGNVATYYVAWS